MSTPYEQSVAAAIETLEGAEQIQAFVLATVFEDRLGAISGKNPASTLEDELPYLVATIVFQHIERNGGDPKEIFRECIDMFNQMSRGDDPKIAFDFE